MGVRSVTVQQNSYTRFYAVEYASLQTDRIIIVSLFTTWAQHHDKIKQDQ